MNKKLRLNFSAIPPEWAGYPVHYKVMNQALERIDDGSIKLDSGDRDAMISLESDRAISAGKYVFALQLPSGQILTRPFEVEDGKDSSVLVPYEKPPEKWLHSQTFLGHALSKKDEFLTMEKLTRSGKISLTADPVFPRTEIELKHFYPQYSNTSILLYKSDMQIRTDKSTLHRIFKLSGQNFESSTIAELRVGKTFATIVLPPLSKRDLKEDLTIDCAWSDVVDSVRDLSVLVNMQNKEAQALLSYMRLGDIDSAQKVSQPVIDQAHQMFKEKMQDVGAACVAAYLLISTSAWEHLPLQWCQNMSEFFPHIADGAIINAHRQIVDLPTDVSADDVKRIAAFLLLASERGLPIFSAGLRLLNDDLLALINSMTEMKIADETFKSVRSAYQRTGSFLRFCDFRNPFTTLMFDSDAERKKLFTYE